MRSLWLCVLALVAGCGRLGFDATAGDGGSGDVLPPAQTFVVQAAGARSVNDAVFEPGGNLAIVGNFAASVTIGGATMTTGTASEDMFVAVVDPAGLAKWLWTGGVTDLGSAQNTAWFPDGSLVASGYFSGRLTNGGNLDAGSRQAAALIRFDPSGVLAFARHYGGTANIQARGVATSSGRVGLGGLYNSTVDFGAGALPATSQDNGYVATMNASAGDVRNRAFLSGSDVYVNDIAISPGGDVFVAGRFVAITDFGLGPVAPEPAGSTAFVASYDADLVPRWVRTFGDSNLVTSVRVLANGDVIAGGELAGSMTIDGFTMTTAGNTDGWIARFGGADGAVAWIRPLVGTGVDAVKCVAVRNARIFLAGQFASTAELAGSRTLVSDGGVDLVVAELGLDGSLLWSKQLGGTGGVDLGIGGMSVDATGRLVAIPMTYDGELVVDGQRFASTAFAGAVVILAIPPG